MLIKVSPDTSPFIGLFDKKNQGIDLCLIFSDDGFDNFGNYETF